MLNAPAAPNDPTFAPTRAAQRARRNAPELIEIQTTVGPIAAWVRRPRAGAAPARPLLALHGISRDAKGLADCFGALCDDDPAVADRLVIAPLFDADRWPVFQRITRRRRPDLALMELADGLARGGLVPAGRFDLFGYSGGAQLAHRFAMVYPQKIGVLHLGAAGWYCLPEVSAPYPYGLGPSTRGDATWPRRIEANLDAFLSLPIRIYVGSEDRDANDPSLRRSPALDAAQGVERHARARAYAVALARAAAARDLPTDLRFRELAGCGHDFKDCARVGGLARLVLS